MILLLLLLHVRDTKLEVKLKICYKFLYFVSFVLFFDELDVMEGIEHVSNIIIRVFLEENGDIDRFHLLVLNTV